MSGCWDAEPPAVLDDLPVELADFGFPTAAGVRDHALDMPTGLVEQAGDSFCKVSRKFDPLGADNNLRAAAGRAFGGLSCFDIL